MERKGMGERMHISKEDYDSIRFEDIKDISVDRYLISPMLNKFEKYNLSDEAMGFLALSLMKAMSVCYKMGSDSKEKLN